MEARSAWTDERLNDRFDHIDGELGYLRAEFAEHRRETREGFLHSGSRTDFLGSELRGEIAGVRSEISSLKTTMIRLFAAQGIAFLGVIAAFFARGG